MMGGTRFVPSRAARSTASTDACQAEALRLARTARTRATCCASTTGSTRKTSMEGADWSWNRFTPTTTESPVSIARCAAYAA